MTTFSLKLTAVVLMTLDHIGLYIPAAPAWLRWLGRGAYPLFLFCMVQGYAHTRSRKRYLLRLYLMSLFMTALGLFLNTRFLPEGGYGNHNIFLPLFLTGVLISAVELYQRDRKRGGLLLGAFFMATDYVTSPVSHLGQAIFGIGCGLITVFIRYFGSYSEGVCYAILIMNLTVWIIDKNVKPRRFGVVKEKKPARAPDNTKKEAAKK